MECKIIRLLKGGDGAVNGAVGLWRESGEFVTFSAKAVVLATGGVGKTWKFTSNSWECTGDGHALALWAGADLIDMEVVQFHPTGMVWPPSARGLLVTEGVRGDGGVLKNVSGERFMFNYISPYFAAETADTIEEADKWYDDKVDYRRPPELLPRDEVARAINTEVKAGTGQPARRRLPRHRLPPFRRGDQAPPALHVPPVQAAGRRRHHRGRHGGRTDLPLHHGRRPGGGGHDRHDRARPVRRRRGGGRHARRQPARRQLPLGPRRLRATRRPRRRRVRPRPPGHPPRRGGRRGGDRARPWLLPQRVGREPLHRPLRPAGHHAGSRRHHPHRERAAGGEGAPRRPGGAGGQGLRGGRPGLQPRLAPRPRPRVDARVRLLHDAVGHRAAREPGRPHAGGLPEGRPGAREGQHGLPPARR